jgi:hypothetical protein
VPGWGAWAALWGAESYQQGYEPLAKQDTLYLGVDGGGGITDLAVDLSQYDDDQATGATWHFEAAPATRFNLTTEWCGEFDVDCNDTDTGRFFTYDCATAASDYYLNLAAGGVVTAVLNSTTVATLTLPGIAVGDQQYVVQWSVQPNPLTTGAANALRSELCAWNVDTGAFDKAVATHVVRPAETGAMNIWAARTTGTTPFTGVPHAVRFGERFHSASEAYVDFVASVSEPSTVIDTTCEHESLPADTTTGIHGRDNFHGPAALWAADKVNRLERRLLSPLYNKRFRDTPTWTDALLSATDAKVRAAPNETQYRMVLGWLQVAPAPETCSHLWVRCHVFSRAGAGAAVPVGVRFYSMSALPGELGFQEAHVTEVVTRDDEVGVTFGQWDVESLVPIKRNADGKTYLAIALCVDPASASANDANSQIIVYGCHAVPCFKPVQGGFPVAP